MNTHAAAPAPAVCTNCNAGAPGNYCSACGESQPGHHDLSLKHFLHEAADELAHVDSKIPATLTGLLFRPGFLSEEYFAGRKTRYLLPLRLFLIIFAINFFLYSTVKPVAIYDFSRIEARDESGSLHALIAKRATHRGLTVQELEERINLRWLKVLNAMEIFSAIIMAMIAAVFFRKARKYFVEHLIFSLHYMSFTLVLSTLIVPVYILGHIDPLTRGKPIIFLQFGLWFLYMWKAVQRFYRQAPLPAAGKTLVVLAGSYIGNVFVVGFSMLVAIISVLRG